MNKYIYLKSWGPEYVKGKSLELKRMILTTQVKMKCYPNRGLSARRWAVMWNRKRHLLANRSLAKNDFKNIKPGYVTWKIPTP